MTIRIRFKKTNEMAVLPSQAHPGGDIGFDLAAAENATIEPGETKLIDTGLQLAEAVDTENPDNKDFFLKIEGRSGLAVKGIFPLGGIIDSSYRGVCKVILHNSSKTNFVCTTGTKVAQMIVYHALANAQSINMDFTEEVQETDRGSNGFGSTGI